MLLKRRIYGLSKRFTGQRLGSYPVSFFHRKVWKPGSTQSSKPCEWHFIRGQTGCQWRMLPKDFAPWKTVYGYFRRLSKLGIWEKVLADLVKIKRLKTGKNENPNLLIIDVQSVKTIGKGEQRGFDGGKKGQGSQAPDRRGYPR